MTENVKTESHQLDGAKADQYKRLQHHVTELRKLIIEMGESRHTVNAYNRLEESTMWALQHLTKD